MTPSRTFSMTLWLTFRIFQTKGTTNKRSAGIRTSNRQHGSTDRTGSHRTPAEHRNHSPKERTDGDVHTQTRSMKLVVVVRYYHHHGLSGASAAQRSGGGHRDVNKSRRSCFRFRSGLHRGRWGSSSRSSLLFRQRQVSSWRIKGGWCRQRTFFARLFHVEDERAECWQKGLVNF